MNDYLSKYPANKVSFLMTLLLQNGPYEKLIDTVVDRLIQDGITENLPRLFFMSKKFSEACVFNQAISDAFWISTEKVYQEAIEAGKDVFSYDRTENFSLNAGVMFSFFNRACDQLVIQDRMMTQEEVDAIFSKIAIEEVDGQFKVTGTPESVDEILVAQMARTLIGLAAGRNSRMSTFIFQNCLLLKHYQKPLGEKLEPVLTQAIEQYQMRMDKEIIPKYLSKVGQQYAGLIRDAGFDVEELRVFPETQSFCQIYLPNEKLSLEIVNKTRLMRGAVNLKRNEQLHKIFYDSDTKVIRSSLSNLYRYDQEAFVTALG